MNDEMENDTKMLVEKALGSMNEKGIRYVDKKVRYAGETFVLRERVGIDGSSSGTATKKPRKILNSLDNGGGNTGGMAALDEIVSKITKYAGINSIQKSQSDWSEFRQISGLESQLEKQRKYGYISKTAFLQKTDWKLHEKELELRKKVDSNNRNI
ncbi:hypothetical protein FG379_002419 [Cryptosporidium bovis]|uniref:uncharacterized protein n=1 Tax=Cryptosporidium bovis TaxID=310047 RepID=UPI003519FF13|nr:hypothetical protein FG379_002419 [Cryptosporidium bovis]